MEKYYYGISSKKSKVLKEEKIPYKGSEVLVVQARLTNGRCWIIVPGYIIGEGITERGIPFVKVKPITSEEERSDLEKLIREAEAGFEGPVIFWW
ncbi:MAG: hypothetical protein QXW65_01835 [Candidatus Pacearchaeota archaeon]